MEVDSRGIHRYKSTACLHGLHYKCREHCKYCGNNCECWCHLDTEESDGT